MEVMKQHAVEEVCPGTVTYRASDIELTTTTPGRP